MPSQEPARRPGELPPAAVELPVDGVEGVQGGGGAEAPQGELGHRVLGQGDMVEEEPDGEGEGDKEEGTFDM